jgi:hypothetical protein
MCNIFDVYIVAFRVLKGISDLDDTLGELCRNVGHILQAGVAHIQKFIGDGVTPHRFMVFQLLIATDTTHY